MNKIIIPTILTATILIAGLFAFMPIEKASTVHTTIQQNSMKVDVAADATDRISAVNADVIRVTISATAGDFALTSLVLCGDTAANAAGDLTITSITVDGDAILAEAGGVIGATSVADGNNIVACQDVLTTIAIAGAGAGNIGTLPFGSATTIVVDLAGAIGDGVLANSDTLTNARATGFVRGDATLTVVSSLP